MSIINKSLAYTDGDTLDTDGHNKNIFSTDLNEGIMSVSNGGLDDTNLASDFTVNAQHVAPEAAVRVRADWKLEALDYNSETVSSNSAAGSVTDAVNFVPVAGTSVRIYLPHSPTLVWWQWSLFVSPWRWRLEDASAAGPADHTGENADMALMAYHRGPDGSGGYTETSLPHTFRRVPESAVLNTVTGGAYTTTNVKNRQARNSVIWDQSHMLSSPTPGWHEVHVRMYLEYADRKEDLINVGDASSTEADEDAGGLWAFGPYEAHLTDRISFGICNSRVMSLL